VSYLLYDIEASSSSELSNKIASYIRRGFEVSQIVVNPLDEKRPYKAFLLNKKILQTIDQNLKLEEKLNIKAITLDVSKCKIKKYFKPLIESFLLGNSYKLLDYNNEEIFFGFVSFINDNDYISKIILQDAISSKNKKIKIKDNNIIIKQICSKWGLKNE